EERAAGRGRARAGRGADRCDGARAAARRGVAGELGCRRRPPRRRAGRRVVQGGREQADRGDVGHEVGRQPGDRATGHAGRDRMIDLPVHTYYPEWRDGVKSRITIRHLLDHTSGLRTDQGTGEIYASPDFVRLALDAEVTSEPGTVFFYNNKAVNLLAGIVERA